MTDLLGIGASGVRAYQTALGVISENIANAGTTGYVRRNPVLVESPINSTTQVGILERSVLGGVQNGGIARQFDAFRASDVRTASSDVSRSEAGISWLERIETALGTNGLGERLTGFFNAGTALAADPTSSAARTDFLAQADATATAFRGTAGSLAAMTDEIGAQAGQSVDALNGLSRGLAQINQSLGRAQPGTNAHASLLDERDRVLEQMSTLASISVDTAASGAATVSLNQLGGPTLVSGTTATELGYTLNESGSISFTLDPYGTPATVSVGGGALAGIADAASRIADAKAQVDTLATDFARQVNAVQRAGVDQDGNAGGALFSIDRDDPAATIAITGISGRGIAAAARFTSAPADGNTGTGIATISIEAGADGLPARSRYTVTIADGTVTITDPADQRVLATQPYVAGGTIEGAGFRLTLSGTPANGDSFTIAASGADSRDNGNLASLATLRTSGRFESRLDTLVSSNASALESRRVLADTQGAIRDNAIDARDSVSGVNLDNEAVELMRFQQAYSASSRVIQVAREMFQSILDVV
jgi:flagellar hook-associated protein 1 FlgK